jgi:hypothetical protein
LILGTTIDFIFLREMKQERDQFDLHRVYGKGDF